MLVLSLLDPWASLVVIGAKAIETRSWPAPARAGGRIAIHASKAFRRAEVEAFLSPPFYEVLAAAGITNAAAMPRGAIIGTARLTGCFPTEEVLAKGISDQERMFGNYEPERWGWFLRDVHRLKEPIPAKGALGLWTLPPDLLARIPAEAL